MDKKISIISHSTFLSILTFSVFVQYYSSVVLPEVSLFTNIKYSTLANHRAVYAQSVVCLATDASLTADQGVMSSIPARSHTFEEIHHEIISMVNLLLSAESFKKGCCQLQAKVCAQSTG